jgi:two-component system, NarL family, nitrate/nitrite response regulator NarL
MNRVRLVVVDDHALFRAGLISLLREMPEFEVVGEASDGQDVIEVARRTRPDVILLDINMPGMGGVETVHAVRQTRDLSPHILMLTISKNEDDLFGAINAGADGYLLKSSEPDELRMAILQVSRGMAVLSPHVTRKVLEAFTSTQSQPLKDELSGRELEVLQCLAQGMKTSQIATKLVISENTVKTHIRHILEKLEVSTRLEAVSKAAQSGLINIEGT